LVLGDQLTHDLANLRDADTSDTVLIAEVADEATYVRHHKKKIILLFSAMRHFAQELREKGFNVRYVQLGDEGNSGSIASEIERALEGGAYGRVTRVKCGEYRLEEALGRCFENLSVETQTYEDDRFVCSQERFDAWADGRKQLRMEYFYREMRRDTGLLIDDDGKPEGGEWNYDAENREALNEDYTPPARKRFAPDKITRDVIALVSDRFGDHFGSDDAFDWAVTHGEARQALDDFIEHALPDFGRFQDAMACGEPFLNHGLISFYLNAGLLTPLEICRRVEEAFYRQHAPLNAVEGFIRQIIGWREYVRGIYWRFMPEYRDRNALNASRPLPDFYWTADTKMRCIREVVEQTRDHAYAHHIQRLMVTGNFALLAGVEPDAINEWYMIVYGDAYEWVELPNVHGMAIYADGGAMASKPYAASGQYINRMSNYCKNCSYSVSKKVGPKACPFNYLYWDFMARNRETLSGNPRVSRQYATYDRMDDEKKEAIADSSQRFFREIGIAEKETT
jgi:deoxyribodipyrimidine photolyase-related protein